MAEPINYLPDTSPFVDHFPDWRVALILTEWHREVVEMMADDAEEVLVKEGVVCERYYVPGAFELPSALEYIVSGDDTMSAPMYDAAICLGVVVKGETPHNEFISGAVFHALQRFISANSGRFPVLCGVLTTNTKQQAIDRANGVHSRKGIELAEGVLSMFRFQLAVDARREVVCKEWGEEQSEDFCED